MSGQGNARAAQDELPDPRERACQLAEAQCTDSELRFGVKIDCKMTLQAVLKLLHGMNEELDAYRFRGRALIREKVYKLASGDTAMGTSLTRTNVVAMELFGRQHLGYTGDGMDSRVHKMVEKAEKQIRGLKAVS